MDVIDKLNDLANGYSGNDKTLVKSTLEYLIRNLTGLENKWFIRMLVKDMKLGEYLVRLILLSQYYILSIYANYSAMHGETFVYCVRRLTLMLVGNHSY